MLVASRSAASAARTAGSAAGTLALFFLAFLEGASVEEEVRGRLERREEGSAERTGEMGRAVSWGGDRGNELGDEPVSRSEVKRMCFRAGAAEEEAEMDGTASNASQSSRSGSAAAAADGSAASSTKVFSCC